MSTAEHMPYKSISPNILVSKGLESYPGLNGTGFFVHFPPFKPIFYVTARHCVQDIIQGDTDTRLMIPIVQHGNRAAQFSGAMETTVDDKADADVEDIAIYVVCEKTSDADYAVLRERALPLMHQEEVEEIFQLALARGSNLRALGYPIHDHPNCATEVDYEAGQMRVQPRGFYGKLAVDGLFPNQYCLTDLNWKEHDYRGFSGSPVIELLQDIRDKNVVHPRVVGVVLMATQQMARFISINVVCNLIATYLVRNGYTEN
ncbi:hypothetical protein [Pseudomonas fontis]|uniref:Trypsin-like peptidase domain-containing protein n=1 Tax=Pseudomonas fontis TaxID=2942633 RepID=A0ABT5P173_9PSED|nr:hypothetical protein [Pseudomonas fontis]MDD0975496.1 hypothetical protein [Pseudomonas fontis]MDD0994215.1 hypothetical protein [Pseudomonas fontis]